MVTRKGPLPFRDIDLGDLLRPNIVEAARKGVMIPFKAAGLLRQLSRLRGEVSAMDLVLGLTEALPSGLYTGAGIEAYMRKVLSDPDRTDDFRMLENELYLAATDLDTCERIVFGSDGWDDVPISTAVRASTALPMVYAPVRVKERDFIDGGIVSTTNLDIAVEAGAKLVMVVNPIVPYVNDFSREVMTLRGPRPRRVSDMGFAQIGYQSFKLLAYQRLHEMARRWEERYPGVDIVLIEPAPDDELMFETSMMNFTSRVDIARHGFQSVTYQLAGDYENFKTICDRHGIDISPTRVRKVVKHFASERGRTGGWRKILEQTTGTLLRQSASAGE
jgi:predicted acylesterase/phospholipase RssA